MEKLVPLMNELQEILSRSNLNQCIDLPQIVVIGAQSTGKSSVLESIIGKDILPRGSGIVTRRPTIIQLFHETSEHEWAEFSHQKGVKMTDFGDVRREIEKETEKLVGNKVISDIPIIVKIHSHKVIDLALVDLPGITKIPVGDQPSDIEQIIKNMLLTYVRPPNSIILALTAANTDLANSDSLKLAREVDPDGVRTIGVVTKIDLMDEGTDALEILQGRVYNLRLGYVGAVCRSQKDITANKSIADALSSEKAFFDNHKIYKKYSDKLGIPYLVKVLNHTLIKHIKRSIPTLRETLVNLMETKESELLQYGEIVIDEACDKTAKGLYLLSLLNKYTQTFIEMLNGKYLRASYQELGGGARVNYILTDMFRKTINEIDPFEVIKDEDIRTAIRNANGLNPSLFLPEGAFENLIRQQIIRLQEPSLECSHLVYEELRRLLFMINIPEIMRFDNLGTRISQVMEVVLQRCLIPTDHMIRNLIEVELGFINTNHPDFTGATQALLNIVNNDPRNGDESQSEAGPSRPKLHTNPSHRQSDIESKSVAGGPPRSKPTGDIVAQKEVQSSREGEKRSPSLWSYLWGTSKNVEELDNKLSKKPAPMNEGSLLLEKEMENTEINMSRSQIFAGSNVPPELLYYIPRGVNSLEVTHAGAIPHLAPPPKSIKVSEKPSQREQLEVQLIKKLLVSYFDVVKKNINDLVPKTVISFLVNKVKSICERELIAALYKDGGISDLLQENPYISKTREECRSTLISLKKCLNILNEFESKY